MDEECEGIKYEDIINYVVSDEGYVVLMQPNINYINSFSSRVSLNIQKRLNKMNSNVVAIPLGRVLGIELLAGLGPKVKVKIIPVGFARPPVIRDTFESAGINQTRHKIYMEVNVKLKINCSFFRKND